MKIILFSRPEAAHTPQSVRRLFDALRAFGFDYALNEEFAPTVRALAGIDIPPQRIYGATTGPQPDAAVMLCYGGDGTLLEGVGRLCDRSIPVLGINAGHLGFLTTAPGSELEELFGRIAAGRLAVEARTLIEVRGDFREEQENTFALNEFTVQRHGAGLIAVETYVDRQMVATYHGDGVVVSTPTGSTAYSLSAGGPVVSPACRCLLLTPLAPHNLTMRPVVIPDTAEIRLRVHSRHADAFVTLDNRACSVVPGAEFVIRRAEQPIFLAVAHNISFYDTLRNKMMWGVDMRG